MHVSAVACPGTAILTIGVLLTAYSIHLSIVESQCVSVWGIAGDKGAMRTWWAGAMDRTRTPDFELKLQRADAAEAEVVAVEIR